MLIFVYVIIRCIDGAQDPVKMFERHPSMVGTQIINYHADAAGKWLLLVGISAKEGRVCGFMQLFSVEKQVRYGIVGSIDACFYLLSFYLEK